MEEPRDWKLRFFTIWTGQALSLFGTRIARFTLIWWLAESTGSATTLVVAALAPQLPDILLGPFIGPLIDRWHRRWIMVVADTAIALLTAVLIVLFARGAIQVWHIYVFRALRSLGSAFHRPAMSASTSMMVPEEHLTRVAGMNQTLEGISQVAAPALAAAALVAFPVELVLGIDVVTALLAVLPLLFVDVPDPVPAALVARKVRTSHWMQMREGFAYVLSHQAILLTALGVAIQVFFNQPRVSLQPLYIKDYFRGGATEFAMISIFFGVGAIGGGLLMSIWGGFNRRSRTVLAGMALSAVALFVQYLAPPTALWLYLSAMVVHGVGFAIDWGALQALYQVTVPKDKQGRVFALAGPGGGSIIQGFGPLGLATLGPLADVIGIRSILLMNTLATLGAGTVFAASHAVRHMGEEESAPEVVPELR